MKERHAANGERQDCFVSIFNVGTTRSVSILNHLGATSIGNSPQTVEKKAKSESSASWHATCLGQWVGNAFGVAPQSRRQPGEVPPAPPPGDRKKGDRLFACPPFSFRPASPIGTARGGLRLAQKELISMNHELPKRAKPVVKTTLSPQPLGQNAHSHSPQCRSRTFRGPDPVRLGLAIVKAILEPPDVASLPSFDEGP